MPKEITLQNFDDENGSYDSSKDVEEDGDYNIHTIHCRDIENLSSGLNFTISGYVNGNGKMGVNETFTIQPEDCKVTGRIKIANEFEVKIPVDSKRNTPLLMICSLL